MFGIVSLNKQFFPKICSLQLHDEIHICYKSQQIFLFVPYFGYENAAIVSLLSMLSGCRSRTGLERQSWLRVGLQQDQPRTRHPRCTAHQRPELHHCWGQTLWLWRNLSVMRRKSCTRSCPAQDRWCPGRRAIVWSWTIFTKGFYSRNCFQVVICCFKCVLLCTGCYHHVALKSTNIFKKLLSTV